MVSTSRRRRSHAPLAKRARSVPYKRPFVVAIFLSVLFYLALIGALAALGAFMIQQNKTSATLLVALGGISSFLWLISFFKRRACHCPLCKGTPYLDSGAHYHTKAVRFFPLNHGTSNVVRSFVRQQFRCQFCGTPFDLLKPKG